VLVVGDLAQIEARLTFWMAGQQNALEAFKQHRDIYCDFGENIYERKITKANVTERFVSKTGVLGLGFGCGADRFRTEVRVKGKIEIGDAMAVKVVDTFRDLYFNVPKLWAEMERLLSWDMELGPLRSEGSVIYLPNGMKIEYPELARGRSGWRYKGRKGVQKLWGGVITENTVQALARIILGDMAIELAKNYRIVTLMHDEIVLCVPEKYEQEARLSMEYHMSLADGWYSDLPIACEVGVGVRYGDAK
jgi:DNA polymerase